MMVATDDGAMLESVTVSEARNFGRLFDQTVRSDRPVRIVRWKRDAAVLSSQALLTRLLERFTFHVNVIPEETGGFTLWVRELEVGAHGATLRDARQALLGSVRSYVRHYFMRWDMYRHVSETEAQLPYVMRLSLADDDKELGRILFGAAPRTEAESKAESG